MTRRAGRCVRYLDNGKLCPNAGLLYDPAVGGAVCDTPEHRPPNTPVWRPVFNADKEPDRDPER